MSRPITPRCSSCGGRCRWADDAWVCNRCGEEWCSEHSPIGYADPNRLPVWEAVKDPHDRRCVVYWRLVLPAGDSSSTGAIGAASLQGDGRWRALGYRTRALGWIGRGHNDELGMHDTRRAAEAAVERYATTTGPINEPIG